MVTGLLMAKTKEIVTKVGKEALDQMTTYKKLNIKDAFLSTF